MEAQNKIMRMIAKVSDAFVKLFESGKVYNTNDFSDEEEDWFAPPVLQIKDSANLLEEVVYEMRHFIELHGVQVEEAKPTTTILSALKISKTYTKILMRLGTQLHLLLHPNESDTVEDRVRLVKSAFNMCSHVLLFLQSIVEEQEEDMMGLTKEHEEFIKGLGEFMREPEAVNQNDLNLSNMQTPNKANLARLDLYELGMDEETALMQEAEQIMFEQEDEELEEYLEEQEQRFTELMLARIKELHEENPSKLSDDEFSLIVEHMDTLLDSDTKPISEDELKQLPF